LPEGNKKRTVTGSVKDISRNTLPGVSINLKGTKLTSSADAQGNFKISVSEKEPVLVLAV